MVHRKPVSFFFIFSAWLGVCQPSVAAEPLERGGRQQLPSSTDESRPNERTGPRVLNVEPRLPAPPGRPLESVGRTLRDYGISPHIDMTEIAMRNPSVGLDTGHGYAVTIFGLGADIALDKLANVKGGTVHFQELYAPWISHQSVYGPDFGAQVGDTIAGSPTPFIPRVSHLALFTYEQRLMDDKLTIEVGKSNAGNYFGLPLCNVPFGCVNIIKQNTAAINPPPYANWSARVAYDFTPQWRGQVGAWRTDNNYPFTSGWERSEGTGKSSVSTTYLASLAYRTDYSMEAYPTNVEVFGFHNNGTQTDPYLTSKGTSKVGSADPADTSKGVSGLYVGGKKTFWRADGGQGGAPNPTALSAYGAVTHTFDTDSTVGVSDVGNAGIILSAPFKSRPFDSYSVNLNWVKLTSREQHFLEDAHALATGGDSYSENRNEFTVGLDANFILTDSIVLSPFVTRTFNANSYLNPYSTDNPRDGYLIGLLFHMQIDQLLGLNGLKD